MDAGLAVDLAWMLHEWNETIHEYDEFKVRLTHPGLARLASPRSQHKAHSGSFSIMPG